MSAAADFKTQLNSNLYGPVQSRRHGLSLGVNVGNAEKVCSWSCLYCQCGFGRTIRAAETLPFAPAREIYSQVTAYLANNPGIESVTFAGNTEPGLYPDLLELIKLLKRHQVSARAKWKLMILSNGSELHRDEVVQAFNLADEAWIKLDCGTEAAFHRLNRPAPFRQGLGAHLNRLQRMRKLHLQTMLWECPEDPTLGNSASADLEALLDCYHLLQPKNIHLYTIARDPAYPKLRPVDEKIISTFALDIRKQHQCEVFI